MARGCPTLGCGGDPNYAAPGRGHIPECKYPDIVLDLKKSSDATINSETIRENRMGDKR